MKKFALIAVTMVISAFTLVTLPAAASAAPFKVGVSAADGSQKVKVAGKLRILVVCSEDCRAKVKIKLITPVASVSVKGGRSLPANRFWKPAMILTHTGKTVLKNNIHSSHLVVTVTAIDSATGMKVVKHKNLGFKR